MFTIEQIKRAHAQVKSGTDFPAYIRAIHQLGVQGYTTYLHDGHTEFTGLNGFQISGEPSYSTALIAEHSNPEAFKTHLLAHQQGQSGYLTFCQQAAAAGIEKWEVSVQQKTVTYFSKQAQPVLIEKIPG